MQQRLDRFFQVKAPIDEKAFNPFGELLGSMPAATSGNVIGTQQEARPKKPLVIQNILDSPLPAATSEISLFTQPTPEPKKLFPDADVPQESVEMVQPMSKDGKRLLYKHPKLPRVGVKGGYFLLVGESDRSEAAWLIQFDGAANPNPGPASSGAVLWSPKDLDGKRIPIFESGKYLGKATNNIAEVQGLLLGLQIAATRGAREILIEGDSELIIFQQTGRYKVSDKNLKVWWANIQAAMMDETAFDWIAIRQVPREQNERADSITKEVLSRKQGFQRA
jgi:ribonuclease HI